MNLGPHHDCVLCGLQEETADHLFNRCNKIQLVWANVVNISAFRLNWPNSVISGDWLDYNLPNSSKFLDSIVATVCWYIWKSSCDLIFNNKATDILGIARAAVDHGKDYSDSSKAVEFFLC